jgi:RHS repeat-associated protein
VILDDDTSPLPSTSLLYAGEMFDDDAQMYYNRGRWYNPSNGTFNRVDPYAGNNQYPQSLHKYVYCHNDPINGVDPSGEFTFAEVLHVTAIGLKVYTAFMVGYNIGDTIPDLHKALAAVKKTGNIAALAKLQQDAKEIRVSKQFAYAPTARTIE